MPERAECQLLRSAVKGIHLLHVCLQRRNRSRKKAWNTYLDGHSLNILGGFDLKGVLRSKKASVDDETVC